jgi:formylglycine-generating enzyme required for sulfatase activity
VTALGQATGAAKQKPLTKDQLLNLLAGGVPSQRAIELVNQLGIDFEVDEAYVRSLRKAGASEALIALLRKVNAPFEGITVETEPSAQVFLDGNLQGQADAQGVLVVRSKVGLHTLKVSAEGKRDFEQKVTVVDGQPSTVVARLENFGGAMRVKTVPGSSVWLDNSIRGTTDENGELLIGSLSPGLHALRVTARGKVDDARNVSAAAGVETPVEVMLADGVRTNVQDGLKYVWISPGNFLMGCSVGDTDCTAPENPPHRVNLSRAYWMGQTEVTVAAYKRYVAAAGAPMPPEAPKADRGWRNGSFPIVDVTWSEANQYCAWIGGRLPTEAEWEYAARGGSTEARPGNLPDIAWTKQNAGNLTHAVGTKNANAYGLFDMLGNVWEWVGDWYDPNYYQGGAMENPTGPASGQEKVLRGGSWIVDPKLLRVSDRYSIKPDARSDYFGFRCVWTPKSN